MNKEFSECEKFDYVKTGGCLIYLFQARERGIITSMFCIIFKEKIKKLISLQVLFEKRSDIDDFRNFSPFFKVFVRSKPRSTNFHSP